MDLLVHSVVFAPPLAGESLVENPDVAISQLQELRSAVSELECPECAEPVHDILLDYIDAEIDVYTALYQKKDVNEVMALHSTASDLSKLWLIEYRKLEEGKPPYN